MPTARQLSAAVKVSARCRGQSGTSPTTHGRLRPLRPSSFLTRAAWSISDLYSRSATCQRAHATARAPVAFRKVALEAPLAGRKAGLGLLYDKIVRKSWAERSRQSGVEHFNIEEASKGLDASSLRSAENEFDRAAKVARASRGVTTARGCCACRRRGRPPMPRQRATAAAVAAPRRARAGRRRAPHIPVRPGTAAAGAVPRGRPARGAARSGRRRTRRARRPGPRNGRRSKGSLDVPICGALAMMARLRRLLRGRARDRRCGRYSRRSPLSAWLSCLAQRAGLALRHFDARVRGIILCKEGHPRAACPKARSDSAVAPFAPRLRARQALRQL